jgi:nucleoside-diphosphate-sugar epimerase
MSPVPAPAKVLVTGVNGYLGAWTAQKYLEAGYSVRGSLRSISKSGAHLRKIFAQYGEKFELVETADVTAVSQSVPYCLRSLL